LNRIEYVEYRKNFEVIIATTAEGEAGWVYVFGQAIPDFGLTIVKEFLGREYFVRSDEVSEAHAGFAVFQVGGLLQHKLGLVLPPYCDTHGVDHAVVQRNKRCELVLRGQMKSTEKGVARL
jgi:hypothetical protein